MYTQLIKAVATGIKEKYPNANIYTEVVEQGFNTPCFFIQLLGVAYDEEVVSRQNKHSKTFSLAIYFYPDGATKNKDIGIATCELYEALNILSFNDEIKLKGTEISSTVEEEALLFMVSYKAYFMDVIQDEYMEDITIKEGVAYGEGRY
ncbi:MAG: phage tail terminator family protein [Anaerotignaceae bacterium]